MPFLAEAGEKAGKNQMSQETCLDLLILCFRRKSEEDVSISLQINFSTGEFSFLPISLQARIELSLNLFDQA